MTTELLSTVRVGAAQADPPSHSRLNTSRGKSFDGDALFAERVTRFAGAFSAIAGAVLGFIGVRSRKLSLASALHAGVSRRGLWWILTLATLAWTALTAVLGAGTIVVLVSVVDGGLANTMLPVSLAAVPLWPGAFAGAWIGMTTIRERHLFDYFKTR